MAGELKGPLRAKINRFQLGGFEVTTLLDSLVVRENIHGTYGGGATLDQVQALARANNIDSHRYEHPFVPTLVNTGKALVLFDTGNGTLAQENPPLRGRLPDGNLKALLAAAGHKPEDIDIIVTTHGHPDHIGGLREQGKPVYPNARYVFGAAEFDFWKRGENVREFRKANRELFVRQCLPLAEQSTFIKPGDDVVTGIRSLDAAGHSPGLMAYHIESESQRLLIWADTCIHYIAGIQRPEWLIDVDDEKDKAVATRKRILDMAATDRLWVTGFHMPFPSVGWIDRTRDGYRWVPHSYQLNM